MQCPSDHSVINGMVLAGLQWNTFIIYIDDIIVGATFDEHLNNLQQVFEYLDKAKLQPNKCHFYNLKCHF